MSPVAAGLDTLLALLLLLALGLGLQLNARLKALRAGQADFAAAVQELNQAAERAEAGLAAIRAASESAHDDLLARIETARTLAGRLERATLDASRQVERVPPTARPAAATAAGGALAAIAALAGGREPGERPGGRLGDPSGEGPPAPVRRPSRASLDEDLFEALPEAGRRLRDLGPLHSRKGER